MVNAQEQAVNAAVGGAHRLALREDVLAMDDDELVRLPAALAAEPEPLGPGLARLAFACVDEGPFGDGRPA